MFRLVRDVLTFVIAKDRWTGEWVPISAGVSVRAVAQFPMISKTRVIRGRFVRNAMVTP